MLITTIALVTVMGYGILGTALAWFDAVGRSSRSHVTGILFSVFMVMVGVGLLVRRQLARKMWLIAAPIAGTFMLLVDVMLLPRAMLSSGFALVIIVLNVVVFVVLTAIGVWLFTRPDVRSSFH